MPGWIKMLGAGSFAALGEPELSSWVPASEQRTNALTPAAIRGAARSAFFMSVPPFPEPLDGSAASEAPAW
jgi:hypothetical protein